MEAAWPLVYRRPVMQTGLPFDGQSPIALITGGARRVGAAIAEALAAAGFDLLLTRRDSVKEADALAERLRTSGRTVAVRHLDLNHPGLVTATGEAYAAALPRLDVLVHNAARYAPTPLETIEADAAAALYRINALSPLLLTARLSPLLRQSPLPGGGAVVCLGDIHAMGRPRRHHAAYAMSKAAVVELVRSLARDLAPEVRVNGIAPGVVLWPDDGPEADPALQRRYTARVPLQRVGTPAELAETVRWLALDARFVTGEFIRLDGGRSLA